MSNRIITPPAILSFPALFEPRAVAPGSEKKKYGCTLVFEKGTDLTALREAAMAAGREKFGEKTFADLLKKSTFKMPFRDDIDGKGYPEGSIFISCRSEDKPQVVNHLREPITERADVYPGARVRASITAGGFDTSGNKGVTFYLNNIQKLGDGPRLDSRKAAEDEFDVAPEPVCEGEEVPF